MACAVIYIFCLKFSLEFFVTSLYSIAVLIVSDCYFTFTFNIGEDSMLSSTETVISLIVNV